MCELGADLPVLGQIGLADADVFADVEPQPFDLAGRDADTTGRIRWSARWSRSGSSRAGGTCRRGPVAQLRIRPRCARPAADRGSGLPRSQRSTQAWWLTPADQYETSSNGTSMSSHKPTIVQYTEWQRPSTFSVGAMWCRIGDVHGHRVGVVQQPGVGAHLRHVPGDAGQHRERSAGRGRFRRCRWCRRWSGAGRSAPGSRSRARSRRAFRPGSR